MNFIDLTGKIFGNITVIRRVEGRTKRVKWFCLCSCGKNTIISGDKIRRGQKNCSTCSKEKRGHPPNFIDLTGKKFGSLLVIRQVTGNKYGHTRYECLCDCGNRPTLLASQLKNQSNCIFCKKGAIRGQKSYNATDKKCSKCEEWKPLEDFPKRKKGGGGRDSYCKACFLNYRRRWVRKNFYGISEDEYAAALRDQNGRCAVCDRESKLIFDHCHVTGKFRGLVCSSCNVILGRFKDDEKILNKAIVYLNKCRQ